MITLDQVLLLQKKVETAVEKIKGLTSEIEQLKADNDALRSKCTELTKALTDKTEFVSTLESEQDKIESTILHALNQLDIVENSILNSGSAVQDSSSAQQPDSPSQEQVESEAEEEENVVDYSSAGKENGSSNEGETDLIEQESEAMRSNDPAQQQGLHNAAEAYVHQSSSMERPESNEDVSLFGEEQNSEEQNPSEQKNSINSEFDIF
ncbi:MAG: cell division protein ZapB [Treponema sp.]|nr:cell division protein ZapB [Treponema sp.]